ncbi:T9SS type A sorting domain-containing protein [Taibaiella soli]|uniref:Secretion system C-terminal sorting domain-containing protein n=1 Tax=Taibaiella soli TaxID=1649169 RepID=A0A2W2AHB4_9BACT|nr:T9SS type A sorting domain-containing protein [Taibaiella soli]PZF74885.1 hypothetical protein DN068_01425 [Taibaiella soli]
MKYRIVCTLAILLAAQFGFAQSSVLDSSFGQNGMIFTHMAHFHVNSTDMVRDTNGRLIMTGYRVDSTIVNPHKHAFIRGYTTAGLLDSSFGAYGIVEDINTSAGDYYNTVAIQADQKIIAGGAFIDVNQPLKKWLLCRYNTSGMRDSSFGINGLVTTNVAAISEVRHILIQQDGKIIAIGGDEASYTLVRYNIDGGIDSSFGNNGWAFPIYVNGESALLQPDGKILLGGYITDQNNHYGLAIERFLSNGSVDSAFGVNGQLSVFNGYSLWAQKLALDSSGRIVAIGTATVTGASHMTVSVLRFNSDGSSDNSFHTPSIVTDASSEESGADILIQPDGKMIAACNSGFLPHYLYQNVNLVRLKANGDIDSAVGQNGVIKTYVPQSLLIASMLRQPDGKIVLTGTNYSEDFGLKNAVMLRYNLVESAISVISPITGIISHVKIYPNPANNQFFVDLSNVQTSSGYCFELMDIIGRMVATGNLKTGVNTINTSSLSNGLYLLQITNGSGKEVHKIVKQ